METPPLPEPIETDDARAERIGRRALWLAICGYIIALTPLTLASAGMRGRNSFATLGVMGTVLFWFAGFLARESATRSASGRAALVLAGIGIVFGWFHAPTIAVLYNLLHGIRP